MNAKKFSDAMGALNSRYLEEAALYHKNRIRLPRIMWGAVAACVALAVVVGVNLRPQSEAPQAMLTIPTMEQDAMGFESWVGYDIATWDNGNPWNVSMDFTTLPVYRNGSYHSAGMPTGLSQEAMMDRLEEAAEALGMEIDSPETLQEGSAAVQLTSSAGGTTIVVEADGTIEVWFEGGLALPEEYSFTDCNTTDAEAAQVLDYLAQQYSALLDFTQPEPTLSGMWNPADGDGGAASYARAYALYDAAGDDLEDILNYTYHSARFYPDGDGKLSLIRIENSLSCGEKMGEYPVITVDEAVDLLSKGCYITSVPYEITDVEGVDKVELVYRNSRTEEVFLPYYRFYVALPEEQVGDGLITYGAYYVPAVQEDYLSNMPNIVFD
ncbi:hypothetical protein [Evtepia sp.]|uniref:hypothetical protein n=1 Tax=Evtepia sp. TaxID=2773933 RepID=UPI002E78F578|nr:hypothetical protein [Evtepia sp.]MEE0749035.1 hypothetical protein [Evtepia sp.]